jgi:hypothetical protein
LVRVCAVILLGSAVRWVIVWVILPLSGIAVTTFQYLRGDASWAAVREARGAGHALIAWVGPKGQEPWTSEYVKTFVRGRGEQRLPLDLLISDDISMARLRHGAIRGRADRHGFKMNSQGSQALIHDCTHRCFRHRLNSWRYTFVPTTRAPCQIPEGCTCTSLPAPLWIRTSC